MKKVMFLYVPGFIIALAVMSAVVGAGIHGTKKVVEYHHSAHVASN